MIISYNGKGDAEWFSRAEMNWLRTLLLSLDSGPERFPIKSRSVINSIQAHSWSTEVPLSCQSVENEG